MKKVLIVSPYFPPTNAADMQRIRMSLPYFKEFGWEPEVVTVALKYTDMVQDGLLAQSLPPGIKIHYVKALPKRVTAKFGLGSIALRSLLFYKRKVSALLKTGGFNLVYFSTTQFQVCILGPYWKKRFGVPYVIDMQDPWHSDFYKNNPSEPRPPKYWMAYQLNSRAEPVAMAGVGGLIAVSEGYLQTLAERYPHCASVPKKTITFGAFGPDFDIAKENIFLQPSVLPKAEGTINIVYIGRGGTDMRLALTLLFEAFKHGLSAGSPLFPNFHFYFIGTSYAAAGRGLPTVVPIAEELGIASYVTEITDRIPFYQTLNTLSDAAALFIPGSTDPQYTASKIYPYVLAGKPLLACFHPDSSVVSFLKDCRIGEVFTFDQPAEEVQKGILHFLQGVAARNIKIKTPLKSVMDRYSARAMTEKQCELFNEVILCSA